MLADLIALGGAPDATHAVFHGDGDLYFCTNAKVPERDEDYWRDQGYTLKRVEQGKTTTEVNDANALP